MTVMTNPANTAVTCLSFADLYALIGPESTGFKKWSDAQALAKELGSNTTFPDADLTITGPGEESGTYDSLRRARPRRDRRHAHADEDRSGDQAHHDAPRLHRRAPTTTRSSRASRLRRSRSDGSGSPSPRRTRTRSRRSRSSKDPNGTCVAPTTPRPSRTPRTRCRGPCTSTSTRPRRLRTRPWRRTSTTTSRRGHDLDRPQDRAYVNLPADKLADPGRPGKPRQ